MKKLIILLLLLLVPLGASAEDADLSWQGHPLRIEMITIDYDEVAAVYPGPTPAEGYLLLARLVTVDGSPVSAQTIDAHASDFLLTHDEGAVYRVMRSGLSETDGAVELIFYVGESGFRSAFSPSAFCLTVSPLSTASAEVMDTVLDWHGQTLKVDLCTDDKARASARHPWPEQGYLVLLRLQTLDGSHVSEGKVSAYAYQIVLLDEAGNIYRPEQWDWWWESDTFSLIYHVQGTPLPALDSFTLAMRPGSALWADANARQTLNIPFADFIPMHPQINTCVMALADQSEFRPNSPRAIARPDEAFAGLQGELNDLERDLHELFEGKGFVLVDDPHQASVLLAARASYLSAGQYGQAGQYTAYHCVLTLTAYDARTHEQIAELEVGSYYGHTISVVPGTGSRVWKRLPSPLDAQEQGIDAFLNGLTKFWRVW